MAFAQEGYTAVNTRECTIAHFLSVSYDWIEEFQTENRDADQTQPTIPKKREASVAIRFFSCLRLPIQRGQRRVGGVRDGKRIELVEAGYERQQKNR